MSAASLIKAQQEHMKTIQKKEVSSDILVELFGMKHYQMISNDHARTREARMNLSYEEVVE